MMVEQRPGTLIHEAFNGLVQRTFPDATLLELYGAGIHWHENGEVSVTCGGKTAIVPMQDGYGPHFANYDHR